ncbi:YlmC/YmxH family sporulation protein [Kyrpidia tusciae]|uniref:Sporulation protein, YlmC/YmxH family n=1 Tax=Kyrpidia tusciae (strain DSM 2912 / NBRC 15312 / T2) TaxID=562970 RepID=D5WQD6_KYRT2|nr:YlmC/YmxH family sporulation protein [Kyrpidia tusciae]ADG06545.1 sporulation protein, YlmC/YmxH family [Kyrpidia tusciae DSM 2912]
MKASELQAKDVVNIRDGARLGMVGDLEIDLEQGVVRAIVVPGTSRWFGLWRNGQEHVIPWDQIVKIGTDVILVELRPAAEGGSHRSADGPGVSEGY